MADYKVLKACRFAGKAYAIGDVVQESVILDRRKNALVRIGIIAETTHRRRTSAKKLEGTQLPPNEIKNAQNAPIAVTGQDADTSKASKPKKSGKKSAKK